MRKDEIRNDMGASVSRMVATGPQVPVPIPVQPAATANLMADALLSRLCKHNDVKVRMYLAENEHTPAGLLVALCWDADPQVRLAVAENRNAHPYLVERAVFDTSVEVRYGLAENHNIPVHLLQKLSLDDNPYVAMRAERTLHRVYLEQGCHHHLAYKQDKCS